MKATRILLLALFISLLPMMFFSCEKDDSRIQYLGNFRFTISSEKWQLGQPTTNESSVYNGLVRKFKPTDSETDLYPEDDSGENSNEKITIEFMQGGKITTLLTDEGALADKYAAHYHHSGRFTHIDTLVFTVTGLGGLGGGVNFSVKGVRY
jgi:hypothetical protein